MGRGRKVGPVEERFWKKVIKKGPDDCWIWTGHIGNGFPKFFMEKKQRYAHIVSWELFNEKKLPKGWLVRHTCMNKDCVNPAHLYAELRKKPRKAVTRKSMPEFVPFMSDHGFINQDCPHLRKREFGTSKGSKILFSCTDYDCIQRSLELFPCEDDRMLVACCGVFWGQEGKRAA